MGVSTWTWAPISFRTSRVKLSCATSTMCNAIRILHTHKSTTKDLMGTEKYIASLHAECDWLVKYYEVRKEARADEIESLGKAKAVLNGADYSLLQRSHARKFLRLA